MSKKSTDIDDIVQCLAQYGDMTRQELLERVDMTRPRLSSHIATLLESGALKVTDIIRAPGRGRPTQVLSLQPNWPQYIGIALQAHRSYLVFADITHQILASVSLAKHEQWDMAFRVKDILDAATRQAPDLSLNHIRAVGLAVPGLLPGTTLKTPIDSSLSAAKEAQTALEEYFHMPVSVMGTIRAAAMAETQQHPYANSCFYVRISDGVGAAHIVDGKVVTGTYQLAGEIGHITVDPQGPQCFCGKRGCLETLCSVSALSKKLGVNGEFALVQAWEDGDKKAQEVITQAASHIGKVLAQAVLLTDPGLVIVAWTLAQQVPQLLHILRDSMNEYLLPSIRPLVELKPALLPATAAGPRGAAFVAARVVNRR